MSTRRTQFTLGLLTLLIVARPALADDSLDAFWAAARSGDLAAIQKMVSDGVDVNAATKYGATALSYAADKGHLPVVRFLLENGANPNVTDTFYKATPMTWAVQNGHMDVAVELVLHGAELTGDILAGVAGSGQTDLLAKLIESGKCQSGDLTRALMATKKDDAKTIAMLKKAGAKPIATVPSKLLDEYAGKYQLQPGFVVAVRRKDDGLVAQLTGQPEFPIYAESESEFFWTVVPATLTFERDNEGKIDRAVLRQMGRTMPAMRMDTTTTKPDTAIDPAVGKQYVGLYESKEGSVYRVAMENERLAIGADESSLRPLRMTGQHVFQVANTPSIKITFQVEGDIATGYIVDQGNEKLVRTRVVVPGHGERQAAKNYARTKPANWTSFRGNNASGIGDGQAPPTTWNAEQNEGIKWKTAIPGLGHSSPVVWGDRVFVTSADSGQDAEFRAGPYGDVKSADDSGEHEWKVYCLSAKTGKIIWEKTAYKGVPRSARHTKGSQASCTPAVSATHVVVNFGSEGLYTYDHAGNQLWKKDLGVLPSGWFYDPTYQWGFSSSPVIHDKLVIIQADLDSGAFIAAYDIYGGSEVWRTDRDEVPSWGTPTIVESDGRVQVVTNSTKHIYGYDLRSGKELWRLAGNSEVTVGTPVYGHGLMFFTGGYTPFQPIYAVKIGASGDISLKEGATENEHVAWSTRRGGTYMPTPIVYEDYLYLCSNQGVLSCFDAKTGKRMYRARIANGKAGSYTASPVAADGKLYFSSEASGIFVVKAGPTYELLSENPMDEIVMATPAITDGLMIVRAQHHVFAFGK